MIPILINGCTTISSRTPAPDYYILTSLKKEVSPHRNKTIRPKNIIVGPVEIPAYLDRDNIVIRDIDNKVTILHFSRWAEPLVNAIERIVSENISILSHDKLACYPFSMIVPDGDENIDLKLLINVYQFERAADGMCYLDVEYFLTLPNNKDLTHKRIKLTETAEGPSVKDAIRCQNRLLDEFSQIVTGKLLSVLTSKNN